MLRERETETEINLLRTSALLKLRSRCGRLLVKGQRINILDFVGHMVSVATTGLYCLA